MSKELRKINKGIDTILVEGHAPLIPSYTPVYIRKQILRFLADKGLAVKIISEWKTEWGSWGRAERFVLLKDLLKGEGNA